MILVLWSVLLVFLGLSVVDLAIHVARHLRWRARWKRDSTVTHARQMAELDRVRSARVVERPPCRPQRLRRAVR